MSFSATVAGSNAAGDGIAGAIVPAHLGFLAIYNPSLGTTDETIEDQIVYYASGPSSAPATSNNSNNSSSSSSIGISHHRFHQPPPPLSPPPPSSPPSSSSSSSPAPTAHPDPNELNERLRQIGLAQGMIAFGKSFSGDQPVDTIETDKTRVVLHELEPGWWILVSINLTRLPLPGSADAVEYSSREVKPATLVLQDLLRAHAIFLLHHDASLSALFARTTSSSRSRFTTLLSRYWDVFLSSWSVLLHGNPVRDVLPGVRMAACGELGVGVGEEDRGSGEREVLEGLVEQTDGLVDLVVCKFGRVAAGDAAAEDAAEDAEPVAAASDDAEDSIVGHGHPEEAFGDGDDNNSSNGGGDWLGTGRGLGAEDGAIFLGVGALSRPSLRTISYWMEDIYSWGQNAYGVADDPSILPRHTKRRKKRTPAMSSISEQQKQQIQERRQRQNKKQKQQQPQSPDHLPHLLPPPPVTLLTRRTKQATASIAVPGASKSDKKNTPEEAALSVSASPGNGGALDKYMSFMKLGYGTYWGLGVGGGPGSKSDSAAEEHGDASTKTGDSSADTTTTARDAADKPRAKRAAVGRYLIGLTSETSAAEAKEGDEHQPPTEPSRNRPNTGPRTVVLGLANQETSRPSSQGTVRNFGMSHDHNGKAAAVTEDAAPVTALPTQVPVDSISSTADTRGLGGSRSEKLRVVVFAKQPFLYTFLFRATAAEGAAVDEEALQTNLSQQVTVLHKSLLGSTSYRPGKPSVAGASSLSTTAASSGAIYDLIWDPRALTIHSTIPNIPDPGSHSTSASTSAAVIQNAKRRDSSTLDALLFPSWSRVEALNTHMQLLSTYAATRTNAAELERTCKTSRGWWVVWNRIVERSSSPVCRAGSTSEALLEEDGEDEEDDEEARSSAGDGDRGGSKRGGSDDSRPSTATAATTGYAVSKEIFLLRRAGDHAEGRTASAAIRAISGSYLVRGGRGGGIGAGKFGGGAGEGGLLGSGWADGASRLAQGMGVDTKKYIEGLLSLNR